jgi:uncharacterized protein
MKTQLLLLTCAAAILFCRAALGQMPVDPAAQAGGINVNALGEIRVKPDVIELKVRVSANAELTDDALVKHRDAKQAIIKAYEKLKLENLKIDEQSLAVRTGNAKEMMQAMMQGMAAPNSGQRMAIDVSSMLRVRLSGISKMSDEEALKLVGKLLDTAQDSGGRLGPTDEEIQMQRYYGMRNMNMPMVRFIVTGADKIREETYQKAVADAKARAERLATLHSVKLGNVTAIQETFVSGELPSAAANQYPYYYYQPQTNDSSEDTRGEVPSDTLSGIPFQVRLNVRFAIAPAERVASNEKH